MGPMKTHPDSLLAPRRSPLSGSWTSSALGLALSFALLACGAEGGPGAPRTVSAGDAVAAVADAPTPPLVEVFVTDWCPYCQRLEAFLQENEIAYLRKNIERSMEYSLEHARLGLGGGIPVTRIGGETVVSGFQPDLIAQAIEQASR